MDLTGLIDKVYDAAQAIDFGRKGFAVRGKAEEGRLSYENGISRALSGFIFGICLTRRLMDIGIIVEHSD